MKRYFLAAVAVMAALATRIDVQVQQGRIYVQGQIYEQQEAGKHFFAN